VFVLIFYYFSFSNYFNIIQTVQAMRYVSVHNTNNLHVQYIYMTSVHCYMFWPSTAIFREPHQY